MRNGQRTADCRDGAFSLIELLVVVSLIALLLGIILPALGGTRRNARTMKGLSNLGQIGRAIHVYAMDNDRILPIGWRREGDALDTNWTTLVSAHLSGAGSTDATLQLPHFSEIFQDPNAAIEGGRVHYAAHPVLMPDITRTSLSGYPLGRLRRDWQVLMVMDSCQVPPDNNSNATAWSIDDLGLWDDENRPIYYVPSAADNNDVIAPGPDEDTEAGAGHIRWRQRSQKAANFLYADGRAATLRREQVVKANIRPDL